MIRVTMVNLALGQTRDVVGRILDYETQQPIKNANILISGTNRGAVSNYLGYFELTIDTLTQTTFVVSHIGYQTSEIVVPEEDRFKFFLKKEYKQLELLNLAHYPKESQYENTDSGMQKQNTNGLAVVESDALYKEGIDRFYDYMGNYLAKNVKSVPKNGANVLFSIDESGLAVDIEVLNGAGDFVTSVKEAFSNMPSWTPATQRQNRTIQHFLLPIYDIAAVVNTSPVLDNFYSFISKTINYPAQARSMGIQGVVFIEFIVGDKGNIVSANLLKDIGAGCGHEANRVISIVPSDLLLLLKHATGFDRFVLPLAFGLQVPFKGYSIFQNNEAYLLREVSIVAIGIVKEVRVTGGAWREPIRTPRNFGFPYKGVGAYTFRSLSEALENPKGVTRLELANKELASFPSDIVKFKNLEVLDLEKNHLIELFNNFDRMPKLKELYLFGNRINELPETFVLLKKLKTLGLSANEFNHFPELICTLKDLESLDISDNNIKELPDNIGNLQKLKIIVLRNNQITRIPESFYSLTNLEQISLEGNPLEAQDIIRLKSKFSDVKLILE